MTYDQKIAFVNNLNTNNPNIRQRIEWAIGKAAMYALDDGGTPSATVKANAKAALANPAFEVNRFAFYIADDTGVNTTVDGGGTVTDATVQTIVDTKRNVAWGT